MSKIQLKPLTILNVPLHIYDNDFTFVVNDEEFKTSKLISDLLSPNICKAHKTDPTFDKFTINTIHQGQFSHILNLVNFEEHDFPIEETPFISEVIEILGNEKIEITKMQEYEEITISNVLQLLTKHEKCKNFFSKEIKQEINFISENFDEIYEKEKEKLMKLHLEILNEIINNNKLKIKDEDELLSFINELYFHDSKYSILYEQICFQNITSNKMIEFLNIFNFNDINNEIWKVLSNRLKGEVESDLTNNRCKEKYQIFPFSSEKLFSGIINYLKNKSENNIDQEVTITSSSCISRSINRQPVNVAYNDDINSYFFSDDIPNSWICFDFKKNRIVLTNYTIKTANGGSNDHYPKSWVIEGSNNDVDYEIIDKKDNSQHLRGPKIIHTFTVDYINPNGYRFIRMRQTGPNWFGCNRLLLDSFECYGKLISD